MGEWIGACEQSTDGEPAENKYFHAAVKQTDDNAFESTFEYYRVDKATGSPLHIGNTTIATAVQPDGTALSAINGCGVMLVSEKPKNQRHDFREVLRFTDVGSIDGEGSGTICVEGLPFGLGKNGKIRDARSAWTLSDGVMTMHQTLKASFRALIFTKSFDFTAHYTARRGSDIASLMAKEMRLASKPGQAAPPGS